jgi:hypothetical protein
MPPRVISAALCIGLMTTAAPAIEPGGLVQVRMTVLDANGHSVNDLQQGDFVLTVDGIEMNLTRWTRAQDLFSHSTYTLVFRASHSVPAIGHSVDVQVKRQGVKLRYPPSLIY